MFKRLNTQKKILSILAVVLVIIGIFVFYLPNKSYGEVVQCQNNNKEIDAKLDCFYELFRDAVRENGIKESYKVLSFAYDESPEFVQTSCHEHSHIIGDTAYYEMYLVNPDLNSIDFPVDTVNCGYGFWHGFIEHLIQDRPEPAFLDKTCRYLEDRFGEEMSQIRFTCYHAAGHGFMLDPIDGIQDKENWGNFISLVEKPLKNCNALNTVKSEISECKIGIFNVIGRWMFDGEYGLFYDLDDPFFECRALLKEDQLPCYNEMAQKLDTVSNWDVVKAAEFVEDIEDDHWASKAFGTGVAGMILRDIGDGSYTRYAEGCRNIPERLHDRCIKGIVSGLMEYGKPEEEYKKAIEFCTSEFVLEEEFPLCHEILLHKFKRFYSDKKVARLCALDKPNGFKEYCVKRESKTIN